MTPQKEQRLRELLQLPTDAVESTALRLEYWNETLMRLGRGYGFEPEAGEYPVHHVCLVRELLPFVSPLLDDARFAQVGPGERDVEEVLVPGVGLVEDEQYGASGRYTLRLMHGDRRYSVSFHDGSDYYNINAVLALLNAALETCDTPLRFFGVGDVVILGPLRGVQQAIREGFIPGFENEGILEPWELEAIDAWSECGDTPESLARQLEKGRKHVRVTFVV